MTETRAMSARLSALAACGMESDVLYYYPLYSLRAATILRSPPLRLQNGYVGHDGILRPIGNRPSDELARARKRRVANLVGQLGAGCQPALHSARKPSIRLNAGR